MTSVPIANMAAHSWFSASATEELLEISNFFRNGPTTAQEVGKSARGQAGRPHETNSRPVRAAP